MGRKKTRTNGAKKRNVYGEKAWSYAGICVLVLAIIMGMYYYRFTADTYLSRHTKVARRKERIQCHQTQRDRSFVKGCHVLDKACARIVRDNFISYDNVLQLRSIAELGMTARSRAGGPTIMDIDTGFVKDGEALANIYTANPNSEFVARFSKAQYELYQSIIEEIRIAIMHDFSLRTLYFSAPTFITRIIGNSSWTPKELHDEYWHYHVDKDNTKHYDYSGLLYLSEYETDFTGGLFAFRDEHREEIIEPALGRLLIFTAGKENLHQVRKVESGTRYVMSMWFTCDARKEFKGFLNRHMENWEL